MEKHGKNSPTSQQGKTPSMFFLANSGPKVKVLSHVQTISGSKYQDVITCLFQCHSCYNIWLPRCVFEKVVEGKKEGVVFLAVKNLLNVYLYIIYINYVYLYIYIHIYIYMII